MGVLQTWAGGCFIEMLDSGSRAKGTAISLASDVDYLVSLTSSCNDSCGGLKSIYESLYERLNAHYNNVRKQNVSIRINLLGLEIDVTPARKQAGNTNYHNLYVSKNNTWQQTNIQKNIGIVSASGRINEIKLLKIWRELYKLDFPSVYLEHLVIDNILLNKSKDVVKMGDNFWYIINELSKDSSNPLFSRIIDPANSNNVLSGLLDVVEKKKIINIAKTTASQSIWSRVIW